MVTVVLLLDTGDTLTMAFAVIYSTVKHWGDPAELPIFPTSLTSEFFLSNLIVFTVQLFYVNQIYSFDKKSWLWCIILTIFAFATLVLGIIISVPAYKTQSAAFLSDITYKALLEALTAIATATDVTAAILLSLRIKQAQPANFKKTNVMIKYLLTFVFARGIAVAALQITFAAVYYTRPTGFEWGVLRILVAKLYGNSFLAMLNSREMIRSKVSQNSSNTYLSSVMPRARYSPRTPRTAGGTATQYASTIHKESALPSIPIDVYATDSIFKITRDK